LVTFRTADSRPQEKLKRWQCQPDEWLRNLKTAVKGDRNGAGAQKPKRFWADAPFSTPQLPFLGLTVNGMILMNLL
jgi:hypothetical protein